MPIRLRRPKVSKQIGYRSSSTRGSAQCLGAFELLGHWSLLPHRADCFLHLLRARLLSLDRGALSEVRKASSTRRRRRRLKGIHSRPDTNRTGAEGLSFYYPRLLHCLDQMLAVMLLSQHRVSSSKTVRPRASCGARCMGHIVSTWSAVCSEAPHSQFGIGVVFFSKT